MPSSSPPFYEDCLRDVYVTLSSKNGSPQPSSAAPVAKQRPRRLLLWLEPLLLSLITTLMVFHAYFGDSIFMEGAEKQSTGRQSLLFDAPSSTVYRSTADNHAAERWRPPVKRRFPDPPAYDFHRHLKAMEAPSTATAATIPSFFYHIYLPDEVTVDDDHRQDGATRENAVRIITEQLDSLHQLAMSQHNNSNHTDTQPHRLPVFYQIVGGHRTDLEMVERLCRERPRLVCHSMGQMDHGREELTTHRLFEFCHADAAVVETRTKQPLPRRVAYLHNKGSHHPSSLNERWRKGLMQAITHPQCLQPPPRSPPSMGDDLITRSLSQDTTNHTCNVCSLFWTVERGIFPAGNMWVTSCDYVRQLVPPLEFEGHMERIVKDALYLQLQGTLQMTLHKPWPPSFGIGRYAAENWIGSHPSLRPCDFSASFDARHGSDNTLDFLDWVNQTATTPGSLRWTMAPSHVLKLPPTSNHRKRRNGGQLPSSISNERMRLSEYFLLAGNVHRWYDLYHQVPGEYSWVWAYYPDGRKWKHAVEQYGRDALQMLLSVSTTD